MIRSYAATDKEVVLSIWRDASALAHPFLSAQATEQAHAMIRDRFLDMAETHVAVVDGQPVGFIALIGNEVGGLFVHPAFHGQGLGTALMDRAVALRGSVELSVFSANAIGRRFYTRYGFAEGEERIAAFFGHPEIRMHYPSS